MHWLRRCCGYTTAETDTLFTWVEAVDYWLATAWWTPHRLKVCVPLMLIPEKVNKLVLWEKRVFLEEQTPQPEWCA
jgi:hypothetical protein